MATKKSGGSYEPRSREILAPSGNTTRCRSTAFRFIWRQSFHSPKMFWLFLRKKTNFLLINIPQANPFSQKKPFTFFCK